MGSKIRSRMDPESSASGLANQGDMELLGKLDNLTGFNKCNFDHLHSKNGIQTRTASTVFDSAGLRDRIQCHGLGSLNCVDALVFPSDRTCWHGLGE
jgi:hypothetical protein